MELGKQIKSYREQNGWSQEKLAEEMYVSRQSISNWENEKSYPDIHNILQLSALFHVSLDELVKGDVDMMKNEVNRNNDAEKSEFNFWGWSLTINMVLTPLSLPPALKFFDLKGLVIPLLFCILMFISAVQAERLKKKNNIQTYAEILAYMEDKEIDKEKSKKETKNFRKTQVLMMLASACAALLLMGIGFLVFLF